jgi:hypothetical protein
MRLEQGDERVRVTRFETSRGISAATNAAAELAEYDVFGLIDHDDLLPRGILQRISRSFASTESLDLLYTDEDQITDWGLRVLPTFKPGASPILSLGFNYVGHFVSLRRSLFETLGGLDPRFDGSQDHDLVLRAFEASGGIRRLSGIGYHWRRAPGSVAAGATSKQWAFESGRRAVAEACRRRNLPIAAVLPTAKPGVLELLPVPPKSPRACWLVLRGTAARASNWVAVAEKSGDCVSLVGVSINAYPDLDSDVCTRANISNADPTACDWILVDADLEPDMDVLRTLLAWSAMPDVGCVVSAHRSGAQFRDLGYSISRTGRVEPITPGLSLRGVAPGLLSLAVREVAAARPGAAWISAPPHWLRRALAGKSVTASREIDTIRTGILDQQASKATIDRTVFRLSTKTHVGGPSTRFVHSFILVPDSVTPARVDVELHPVAPRACYAVLSPPRTGERFIGDSKCLTNPVT